MKLTKSNSNHTIPLFAAIIASLIAVAMIATPFAASAQTFERSTDRNYSESRTAYSERSQVNQPFGQMIAPVFIENFFNFGERFDFLPPALAAEIAKYLKDDRDDDDDDRDAVNPRIMNVVIDAEEDEVKIDVRTDEPTIIELFASTDDDFDINDDDVLTDASLIFKERHMLELDDLDEDTRYYYRLVVEDRFGNDITTPVANFRTASEDDDNGEALTIRNVNADADDDSVTVSWDTNRDADSTLYLSTEQPVDRDDDDTIVETDDDFVRNHELTADDLEEDTTYYGIVESTDDDGNTVRSSEFSVTTSEDDDTAAPIISDVSIDPNQTSATFTWETNEDATSEVFVSTNAGFDLDDADVISESDDDLVNDHNLTVDGLDAETDYYARIVSEDAAGNQTISEELEFSTDEANGNGGDTTAPTISNVQTDPMSTSITVSWTTNEETTATFYSSENQGFSISDADVIQTESNTLTTEHEVTVSGLEEDTTYYHRILVEDEAGNETLSTEYTVATE